MAMIDYGAVVFKNGRQINHDMFMDMQEAVGWVDVPRKRYPDCDFVDDLGYSLCENCPKAQWQPLKCVSDKGSVFVGDCRGSKRTQSPGKLDGNYFAFVGDRELTFCFYKHYCAVVVNGKVVRALFGADTDESRGHMSFRGEAKGIPYHIRNVGGRNVWLFSARYKGDTYNVIYGYGIDVDRKCWNRIKVRYLGRKASRAVDRLYARFSTDR